MDRFAAMEAFVRVVDAGSFSGAAKQLRMGQPAVSKTIAQLEDRLDVRLLLRSTHGLAPTEAGRNFYDRAKRSLGEADEAELAARGAAATLSGRLRLCAPVTFTRLYVLPRLSNFLADHASLDIDVVLDDGDIDLIAAGIDVALLIGRLADSAVTARKIAQCRRRVIGTPAYFEAKGVPHSPADLLGHQAVIYDQREGGGLWSFRQGTSETTITVSGRLRVSATEGLRAGVLAGVGFAIASEWAFAPELKSGAVISVLDDWLLPLVDLWAVFPAGRQTSAKARAFACFVEAAMSDTESADKNLSFGGIVTLTNSDRLLPPCSSISSNAVRQWPEPRFGEPSRIIAQVTDGPISCAAGTDPAEDQGRWRRSCRPLGSGLNELGSEGRR